MRMAYVARTPSGICTGVVMDDPEALASTALCVAEWIKRGDVVTRTTGVAASAELEHTLSLGQPRKRRARAELEQPLVGCVHHDCPECRGRAERLATFREVVGTTRCSQCEYDEAEGAILNHCASCCHRITQAAWKFAREKAEA